MRKLQSADLKESLRGSKHLTNESPIFTHNIPSRLIDKHHFCSFIPYSWRGKCSEQPFLEGIETTSERHVATPQPSFFLADISASHRIDTPPTQPTRLASCSSDKRLRHEPRALDPGKKKHDAGTETKSKHSRVTEQEPQQQQQHLLDPFRDVESQSNEIEASPAQWEYQNHLSRTMATRANSAPSTTVHRSRGPSTCQQ
jgi:hypothetical protein